MEDSIFPCNNFSSGRKLSSGRSRVLQRLLKHRALEHFPSDFSDFSFEHNPVKKVMLVKAFVDGGEMFVWKVLTKNDQVFYYKFSERKGYSPNIEISNEKEYINTKENILTEKEGFLVPMYWYIIDFDSPSDSLFSVWDTPGLISLKTIKIPV